MNIFQITITKLLYIQIIEVSIGEIVDKLSILRLKLLHISDKEKLKNVTKEYDYLYQIVFNKLNIDTSDFDKMVSINKILWDVEDRIREKEREKQFDSDFIEMARTVQSLTVNKIKVGHVSVKII